MTIYCPTCNRSSDDTRFIGSFCEFCIIKKIEKNIPESITIYHCRFCNKIKEVNTFVEPKKRSFAGAVQSVLKLNNEWKVKVNDFSDSEIDCVFIKTYEGEKVAFPKMLKYKFAKETCERCERISGGYYEALVQLRGDWDRINSLIRNITKYVERREGFIAKIESVPNGKDIYVSNKMMMNEFFNDYDLKPTRSFRLYGVKRGKKVYRNTYSLHL